MTADNGTPDPDDLGTDPALVTMDLEFDASLLTEADLGQIQSQVVAAVVAQARELWRDEPEAEGEVTVTPSIGGGGSGHSKHIHHTKIHSRYGRLSTEQPADDGEKPVTNEDGGEVFVVRPRPRPPYSKSFSKSGGYSKRVFGKVKFP